MDIAHKKWVVIGFAGFQDLSLNVDVLCPITVGSKQGRRPQRVAVAVPVAVALLEMAVRRKSPKVAGMRSSTFLARSVTYSENSSKRGYIGFWV